MQINAKEWAESARLQTIECPLLHLWFSVQRLRLIPSHLNDLKADFLLFHKTPKDSFVLWVVTRVFFFPLGVLLPFSWTCGYVVWDALFGGI
jgi:hypothetical protein